MSNIQDHLHYQIIGEDTSPKLVFLHGIMGQGRNWASIAKRFSRNYQCLIYDQRGHGRSFHPSSGFELEDYSRDLEELLDFLGWSGPIYLVGHSMGGRVALHFADRHPERVDRLVIVDIGPSSDWQSMSSIIEKLDFVPSPFGSRDEARHFFAGPFMEKYKSKMLSDFFYSNLVEKEGGFQWIFSKELIRKTLETSRHRDYWGEFRQLAMETLYIRGGNSTDLKRDDFEKVLANNPKIKGVEVEGAGHWVHAEKPTETIRIIEDFFNIAGRV